MLYAFGSNGSGQLGVGHEDDLPRPSPSTLDTSEPIKQIAAGGNHTVFLNTDGRVAVTGSNGRGQCNFTTYGDTRQSKFETAFYTSEQGGTRSASIAHVAATWNASILCTFDGQILVVGEGLNGELGLGHQVSHLSTAHCMSEFPPAGRSVVQLAACMAHVVAVLDDGTIYGWGKGSKGQLGEPAKDVCVPRKIQGISFAVSKAVCGKDFTCLVSAEGELSILGLKTRDRFNLLGSKPLAISGWKDVAASWGSVFILMNDGKLISFGRNDHGQLAPSGLPSLSALAAGSEHCLAISDAGEVLAWGWGEHGNCGEPTNHRGDVNGRWNVVALQAQKASAVFAGCATSFVLAGDDQT
ncbi:RCC1/BLIP-II protein [Hortaea werneckii]|nr:RCC1/BLIP-II protein [Hortaea werneckii]KAI7060386.1 RCC1/BLIP-II protein [Hortaea werneckii]KAI7207092.1 RCC1/BLIP-II protein [Hortaea werneckii]KAI7293822.1 RCC1/BLIP-II protein [Hortaea werneckii]